MQDRRAFILGGLGLIATALPVHASTGVEDLILGYTNQLRQQNRRTRFRQSRQLTAAAERYARVLAQTGVFSHTADGTTLKQRVKRAGYKGGYMAENVAYRPLNMGADALARKFVVDWANSKGHRRNLLHPKLTEIGVGLAQTNGRVYAVQVFGGH